MIFVERIRVEKEDKHVAYFDIFQDAVTGVQYIGYGSYLVPRYNPDGTMVVGNK